MIYLSVHGLVIKTLDYKDNDKILTILTFEKGKISVIAKGVRKQNAKLSFSARLFYCGEFECVLSQGRLILTGSSILQDFSSLANDLETLYCACHLIDVAKCVIMEDEPAQLQMKLLLNSLYVLNKKKMSYKLITAIFELRLLKEEGFSPCIDRCVVCYKEYHEGMYFSCSDGGMVCCKEGIGMSLNVVRAMDHILESDIEKLFSFRVSMQTQEELFDISRHYTNLILDQEFKKLDNIPE